MIEADQWWISHMLVILYENQKQVQLHVKFKKKKKSRIFTQIKCL